MSEVVVLRWGHRPRDERVTTHVALTARALGASGIILSDVKDETIKKTIDDIVKNWGGTFSFQMGVPWRKALKRWKARNGVAVHLTAYGEDVYTSNILTRIRNTAKDVMVMIGSRKVPKNFFLKEISDFNVAIGNQPHSECSSLAIFLDRFFSDSNGTRKFENAKLRIIPQKHGKKVVSTTT